MKRVRYNIKTKLLTSWRPRPSAARRLSKGMVKPLLFFQFEMQGGIIHSFCSAAVALRGGLRRTGGGGLGGPRGIFLCLKRGGSRGSSTTSDILIIRCFSALSPPCCPGVYRMNDVFPWLSGTFFGCAALILPVTSFSSATRVFSAVACTSSSEGRSMVFCPSSRSFLCARGTRSLNCDWMVLPSRCPWSAMASYRTFPSLSTCSASVFPDEACRMSITPSKQE